MKGEPGGKDELIRCVICEAYLSPGDAFICPKCRRGPLCRIHRIAGRRICASCVFEQKADELGQVQQQIGGITVFLRFTQFLFIVFAIVFAAVRLGPPEVVEHLNYSIITDNLVYLCGASVCGYVVFFVILLGQKQHLRALEEEMSHDTHRRTIR